MQKFLRLDPRRAKFVLEGKSINLEALAKILNEVSGKVATFYLFEEGNIYLANKTIFSVRSLEGNFSKGTKRDGVLLATVPNKKSGFYVPWNPYERGGYSSVVQVASGTDLLFENSTLIKRFELEKFKI